MLLNYMLFNFNKTILQGKTLRNKCMKTALTAVSSLNIYTFCEIIMMHTNPYIAFIEQTFYFNSKLQLVQIDILALTAMGHAADTVL